MSYDANDVKTFRENELKTPDSTFCFECKMCGGCCRRRKTPIVLTGADLFRMARALGVSVEEALRKNTTYYLGDQSHVPLYTLTERDDGSCRLLRKGRCMVHSDKPAVCALFPLGRITDARDGSITYFFTRPNCPGANSERIWTLKEWQDEFQLLDTEADANAWSALVVTVSRVTARMQERQITTDMIDDMKKALYTNYDTSKPYIEQAEENKREIEKIIVEKWHKKLA